MTEPVPIAAQPSRHTDVLVRQRDGRVVVLRYSNDPAHPSVRLLQQLDLAPAAPVLVPPAASPDGQFQF